MTKTLPIQRHDIYRTLMEEAKIRLVSAEKIISRNEPYFILPTLDIEFCYLQIRRVIECLTFAMLVRDQSRYKALKDIKRETNPRLSTDIKSDWNAPEILKELANINPYSLPIPLQTPIAIMPGQWHFDRKKTEIRLERLIDIYKKSSGFLHARNPLKIPFDKLVNDQRKEYQRAPRRIERDVKYLRNLLWNHAAIALEWDDGMEPRDLASPGSAWIVSFGSEELEDVSLIVGVAQ